MNYPLQIQIIYAKCYFYYSYLLLFLQIFKKFIRSIFFLNIRKIQTQPSQIQTWPYGLCAPRYLFCHFNQWIFNCDDLPLCIINNVRYESKRQVNGKLALRSEWFCIKVGGQVNYQRDKTWMIDSYSCLSLWQNVRSNIFFYFGKWGIFRKPEY